MDILKAHKYERIKNPCIFQAQISIECYFFMFINIKMPTIVGILTFLSEKNFMLNRELSMNFIYKTVLSQSGISNQSEKPYEYLFLNLLYL